MYVDKEIGIVEAHFDPSDPHDIIIYDRRHFSPITLKNFIELEGAEVWSIRVAELQKSGD